VESGSLSQASRAVVHRPAALSQQLGKLETEVGKSLLSRSSKGSPLPRTVWRFTITQSFQLRQLDQALSIARRNRSRYAHWSRSAFRRLPSLAIGLPLVPVHRERYPSILLMWWSE